MYPSSQPAAQIIALSELPDAAEASGLPLLEESSNPLHQIKTRLQVCVGGLSLTVGELMAAKTHQVLVLDRKVDQAVDLVLEGRVIARGLLVAVDDHFAVRIDELPLPLKP